MLVKLQKLWVLVNTNLGKKPSCKKEYSATELNKLKKEYELYRKNYWVEYYQNKKKEPNKVKKQINKTHQSSQ